MKPEDMNIDLEELVKVDKYVVILDLKTEENHFSPHSRTCLLKMKKEEFLKKSLRNDLLMRFRDRAFLIYDANTGEVIKSRDIKIKQEEN
ncbi:hypothetical protein vBSscSF1_108 [Staphylococcus phage vB-SscS-F1]|nr:hypothetical protein vBApySJF1_108 [Arcanobacterium phage vB-ApyS-JF1]